MTSLRHHLHFSLFHSSNPGSIFPPIHAIPKGLSIFPFEIILMDLPLFLLLTLLKYKFSIKYLSEVENKQLRQISLVRKPGVTSDPGKCQRPSEVTQECQEYSDNSMISRLSVLSPIISSALKVDLCLLWHLFVLKGYEETQRQHRAKHLINYGIACLNLELWGPTFLQDFIQHTKYCALYVHWQKWEGINPIKYKSYRSELLSIMTSLYANKITEEHMRVNCSFMTGGKQCAYI